ncbi:hypothetical protein I6A84_15540 [Frankia sp. CNm7]|uniref:Uncharacterized protein n=1 Tax=Frankia nepalensis TaxID=1836974 RepID=A0A937UPM6_9ACTN|nr:hypothetical protein [Frankia nepalensis]MBL7498434.1 hypothetical protein [Frankia nepalensis]MBL7512194.1 hypothetical protein [Frankia nepalensis]MBL7519475.1 hypothetical protein [Frankia nepalensis]MBL7629267.1 hypothetical protein [Frankia nepalensis]
MSVVGYLQAHDVVEGGSSTGPRRPWGATAPGTARTWRERPLWRPATARRWAAASPRAGVADGGVA